MKIIKDIVLNLKDAELKRTGEKLVKSINESTILFEVIPTSQPTNQQTNKPTNNLKQQPAKRMGSCDGKFGRGIGCSMSISARRRFQSIHQFSFHQFSFRLI